MLLAKGELLATQISFFVTVIIFLCPFNDRMKSKMAQQGNN